MVSFILLLLCLASLAYATGVIPSLLNLPSCDVLVNVSYSLIAAYIFYLIQIVFSDRISQHKYKKFFRYELGQIANDMKLTLCTLSGRSSVLDTDADFVKTLHANIDQMDVFEDGSRVVYEELTERTVIDALWILDEKIHKRIFELIGMRVIDQSTIDILVRIEQLPFRAYIEELYRNKEGNTTTIDQINHKSFGGAVSYDHSEIKKRLKLYTEDYIKLYRELQSKTR